MGQQHQFRPGHKAPNRHNLSKYNDDNGDDDTHRRAELKVVCSTAHGSDNITSHLCQKERPKKSCDKSHVSTSSFSIDSKAYHTTHKVNEKGHFSEQDRVRHHFSEI